MIESYTTVASATMLSTRPAMGEDMWNLDLDDLLENMPDQPPLPAMLRSKTCGDAPAPNAATSTRQASHKDTTSRPIRRALSPTPPNRDRDPSRGLRRTKSNDVESTRRAMIKNDPSLSPRPARSSLPTRGRSPATTTSRTKAKSPIPMPSFLRTISGGSRSRAGSNPDLLMTRTVSFGEVRVREFEQILGDNPCKDHGPSLALGWQYNEKKETCVDKFEKSKGKNGNYMWSGSRSSPKAGPLSPKEREKKALKLGFSDQEIQENRKQNKKLLKQYWREDGKQGKGCVVLENGFCLDEAALLKAAKVAKGFK